MKSESDTHIQHDRRFNKNILFQNGTDTSEMGLLK